MNKKLRLAVLKRDDFQCQCCGNTRNLELHHIVFRSQGGKDQLDNLVTLCNRCHARAHREKEWRKHWERWIKENAMQGAAKKQSMQ